MMKTMVYVNCGCGLDAGAGGLNVDASAALRAAGLGDIRRCAFGNAVAPLFARGEANVRCEDDNGPEPALECRIPS